MAEASITTPIAALRKLHYDYSGYCWTCLSDTDRIMQEPWPCPTSRHLDELEATLERVRELCHYTDASTDSILYTLDGGEWVMDNEGIQRQAVATRTGFGWVTEDAPGHFVARQR